MVGVGEENVEYGGSEMTNRTRRQRRVDFGSTEDDVNELLCQGVKPWDDDAWVSVFESSGCLSGSYMVIVLPGCSGRNLLTLTAANYLSHDRVSC